MPLHRSCASGTNLAIRQSSQHQQPSMDDVHQVVLIFPVLALLSHAMQLWIPPSRIADSPEIGHDRRRLKQEYASHELNYGLFASSLKDQASEACKATNTHVEQPSKLTDDAAFHESPAYNLAELLRSLSAEKGSTRLEMATYVVGKAGSNNVHVDILDAVVFRIRSTTSLATDQSSSSSATIDRSKLYEFPLRDWLTLRAHLEADGSCALWWDSLDTQLWRATDIAYLQVTKRLVAQGVREPDTLLHSIPRRKARAAKEQRSLGLAGLLDDVDDSHLNNYILNESRDVSSTARWLDCVVLPLAREIAPLGCDANWIETMAETQRLLAAWRREHRSRSRKTPKHVRRELRPLLAIWRMGDERMQRQAWLEETLQAAEIDAADKEVDLTETLHSRVERYLQELLPNDPALVSGTESKQRRRRSRFDDYPWVIRA